MRNIVIGLCSTVFLLLIILISSTLYGRSVRQSELQRALNSSMKMSMEALSNTVKNAPASNDELVAFFMESFVQQIDSKSNVTIEVLDVDYKKGLLSVKATLKYAHLNGRLGTVSAVNTLVLEQFKNDDAVMTITYNETISDSGTGYSSPTSTVFYLPNKSKLVVKTPAAQYILTTITGIDEEGANNTLTSATLKSGASNTASDVVLNVGQKYSGSYLSTLYIANADIVTNLVFTKVE